MNKSPPRLAKQFDGGDFLSFESKKTCAHLCLLRKVEGWKIDETVNYYQLFMEIFVNYFTWQHLQLLEKYGKINSPTNGNYLQFDKTGKAWRYEKWIWM